jgi:ribosome recycling factor
LYFKKNNNLHFTAMDLDSIYNHTDEHMAKAIGHLEVELTKIRAGRITADILDGISVDYYGMQTPVAQAANVSTIDARTLQIQPFEKNMLGPIEKAIFASNMGITPGNDGVVIRLFMPPLTEERRKEFVKKAHAEGEHAKVAIRNIRRDGIEDIKKLQKDGLSEDQAKSGENAIQALTDKKIAQIDSLCAVKEKELLTV